MNPLKLMANKYFSIRLKHSNTAPKHCFQVRDYYTNRRGKKKRFLEIWVFTTYTIQIFWYLTWFNNFKKKIV